MSRDLVEKIVKVLEGNVHYGDVRFEYGEGKGYSKNKTRENIGYASSVGLSIRISSDNRWHYLGFDNLDESRILEETRRLVEKIGNKKSDIILQDPWELDKEVPVKEDPNKLSDEEKIEIVRDIFKKAMGNEKIINVGVSLGHSKNETVFMNTEGSKLRQVLPFYRFIINATSKEGKRVESDYFVIAKQGGHEHFSQMNIDSKVEEVVKNAIKMLGAKTFKGGKYDIMVDNDISGVIAHESFGHGLEADQVMRDRSYLSDLVGKKVISDLVSIHDNSAYGGERGFFFFDDEGIGSSDSVLVENGMLKQFMNDRTTGFNLKSPPTGSARAQDFSRKVFIRMSNTYISPGDWKHDELLADTKSGFYLEKALTGMEDPLGGNMQIITGKVYEIKNGELGQLFKGAGITGKVLEFLSNVDAVTNDFKLRGSGCGKGHEDYVPVSSGGPFMRIRGAVVG
jgi:TldD protein